MIKSNVIEIQDLNFSYSTNSKRILNKLSLKVPRGSIYGFLGPNGAGKSTTMQLLTGSLTCENKNAIKIFNEPLAENTPEIFLKLGCLIETPSLYTHLTAYDNLKIIAGIKLLQDCDILEVLELIGLKENMNQKVKEFSLGMKQRLGIGIALLGKPDLLLLDEPINGLDPQGVIDIRELLIKLNSELGTSIFISSHLLDEIERICSHIGVLSEGKLVFEGAMETLKLKAQRSNKTLLTTNDQKYWYKELLKTFPTENIQLKDNWINIENNTPIGTKEILFYLLTNGAEIIELKTSKDLEDMFLDITR